MNFVPINILYHKIKQNKRPFSDILIMNLVSINCITKHSFFEFV